MPNVIQERMKSLQIKGMHNTNYFLGITENTSNISNRKSEDFMVREGNCSSKSKELMGHLKLLQVVKLNKWKGEGWGGVILPAGMLTDRLRSDVESSKG